MPVQHPKQETETSIKGSYDTIYTISQTPPGKGLATPRVIQSYAAAIDDKKIADLNGKMRYETTNLHGFYNCYVKKEFFLKQALAGTAAKLNLFVNTLIDFDELYQLDIKLDTGFLKTQTTKFHQQCQSVQYNHFNSTMSYIIGRIRSCFIGMEKVIKQDLTAKEISPESRETLKIYFSLMNNFISNCVRRTDIYALPNPPDPEIVNYAETEQQQNLERAFNLVFPRR